MIILDPGFNDCIVWMINPYVKDQNKVTRIKGTVNENCESLINRLTEYKKVKNQYGNYVDKLVWKDYIYLDVTPSIGRAYLDIFTRYDLPVEEIRACNPDSIIPVEMSFD